MRIFKRSICTFVFLAVLGATLYWVNYMLVDDNTYTRIMLHEMYEQQEIDTVFIGASVAYRHIDPKTWDEATGQHSFNCGSSSQRPIDSYYLMREVLQRYKPKYCLYSLHFVSFVEADEYKSNIQTEIIFDHLPFSLNKISYANAVYTDGQTNAWIPILRNSIPGVAKRINLWKLKETAAYREFLYDAVNTKTEQYRGRGFVYRDEGKAKGRVGMLTSYRYSDYAIDNEQVQYFIKLAELCKQNNCQLIAIDSPIPYAAMTLQNDYQAVLDFYRKLANEANVEWLPMDIAKPSLFSTDDCDFYDAAHMNGGAAQRYSEALASLLMKKTDEERRTDYLDLFYSDYHELLADNQRVYSAWLTFDTNGVYYAHCMRPSNISVEYRFSFQERDAKTWTVLQEYSEIAQIDAASIPAQATLLRVDVRPVASNIEYQQYEVIEVK